MLLAREQLDAPAGIERLVSVQAQFPKPAYIGLWTRLEDFRAAELTERLEDRSVVRATMMRHTLHLVSARDYLAQRSAIQPAIRRGFQSVAGDRLAGVDLDRLVAAARAELAEGPRTFAELRETLVGLEPDREPSILGYAVRSLLPLVQVPTGGPWAFPPQPRFTEAEDWLGASPDPDRGPDELVRRYLAAFGPASVRDAQTWSGLAGLAKCFARLRPELRVFHDERGVELFDLPAAPRPPENTPAPARLLPDYDNLMVAYADRSRVIADEHRPKVSLSAARVRATFLLDGVVAGTWKLEPRKRGAGPFVVLEPFGRLAKRDRVALEAEASGLLAFLHGPDVAGEVRVG